MAYPAAYNRFGMVSYGWICGFALSIPPATDMPPFDLLHVVAKNALTLLPATILRITIKYHTTIKRGDGIVV